MTERLTEGVPTPGSTDSLAEMCLRGILAGPDAVIYFKDRQSRFILVSEATAAKHGLTQEQMVDQARRRSGCIDRPMLQLWQVQAVLNPPSRHRLTSGSGPL